MMQLARTHPTGDVAAGARNLLVDCAGVKAGDDLLLLVEPAGSDYYQPEVCAFVAQAARALGAHPRIVEAAPDAGPDEVPAAVMEAIGAADHTLFLNRLGDQLRFRPLPGRGGKTMSYALDMNFLGSSFCTTPYPLMAELSERLAARLASARSCRIRCPLGTDLRMDLDGWRGGGAGQFTARTFPVMILAPLPASAANGRLMLSQAITSTDIHPYADSIVPLPSPIALTVKDGRIVCFEGDAALVDRVRAQFERVAQLFGGAAFAVNSWHTGINPMTYFPRPALSDMDRWSGLVFGSPRYTHFHMCGHAPGDIAGQVFDATIGFDGEPLWEEGRLGFYERPANRALIAAHGLDPAAFAARADIGVRPERRAS